MTGRDGRMLQATRIALVPDHDEIDWQLSKWATDTLELGELSFESDLEGARWMRATSSWRWYCLGNGRAAFLIPVEPDTLDTPTTFLRVGECLYRIERVKPFLYGYLVVVQLVQLCAPVEDQAEEADEQWRRA